MVTRKADRESLKLRQIRHFSSFVAAGRTDAVRYILLAWDGRARGGSEELRLSHCTALTLHSEDSGTTDNAQRAATLEVLLFFQHCIQ